MKARSARVARARLKREYHFAINAQDQCEVTTEDTLDIVEVDAETGKISLTHLVIHRLNIVRPMCSALLGEDHSVRYRMGAGVVIMAVGVTLAKTVGHIPHWLIGGIGDAVGYGLHGLGLVPFIDHLAEKFKKVEHKK